MKTLFAVIGNICSGKSTTLERVAKETKIPIYQIDKYRIEHRAFDILGENGAWRHLINDIKRERIAIFEFSGVSRQKHEVFRMFDRVVIIKLVAGEKTLTDRLYNRKKSRDYDYVPYAFTRKNNISELQEKLYSVWSDYELDSEKMSAEEMASKIIEIINKIKLCQ